MRPLDPDWELLLRQWIEKADTDLEAATELLQHVSKRAAFREIVGFHCQQCVEKYLKVLLTFYQVDFPKTHDIEKLLALIGGANPEVAGTLAGSRWLTPFGVEIRYPGDAAEMRPGEEVKAIELARLARTDVLRVLEEG